MSIDQMSDVFPIIFNFQKGELATAEKLTGAVKLVDTAFSEITRAVGDPWDSQTHSWGLGSNPQTLSLEKLSQSSLARIIGPSDYASPIGGDFNESPSTSITVQLTANKNSWNLGYPLVTVSSTVAEDSTISSVTPLEWGTDITVLNDTTSFFNLERNSIEDVVNNGDFFVDYYKGVITTYQPSSIIYTLQIDNIHMLSAGPPWASHNVIPPWRETSALCSVSLDSDDGTTSIYTLTLPEANSPSRVSSIGKYTGTNTITDQKYDANWNLSLPNINSRYRVPPSLITSSMTAGDTIPEGFMLLWDEVLGRTLELITFSYLDENSLTLTTSSGYLNEGTGYRLITSGCSLSESISYLMAQQRFANHAGLNSYAGLGYSIPISHNNLEDRYTGSIGTITSPNSNVFKFRESDYPTNPHPQYLHRAGYLSRDITGNTANAMRGILGFSETYDYGLRYGTGSGSTSGNLSKTYGIYWGGPGEDQYTGNTRLLFDGGEEIDSWSSSYAHRFGFGLADVGANPISDYTQEKLGALTFYPWYGTPVYFRGQRTGPTGSDNYLGAVIGFDIGRRGEMNYIKVLPASRSTAFDVPHLISHESQNLQQVHPCMPNLAEPVAPSQLREFRFRGVAYCSSASNPEDSIGGSTTRSDGGIEEFQGYYTSPAVVGADFFNVYSNAIFFSERGDGVNTSLTSEAIDYFNTPLTLTAMTSYYSDGYFNSYQPTGFYYHPRSLSVPYGDAFLFSIKDTQYNLYSQPLRFGDRAGFHYASNRGGDIRLSTRPEGSESTGGILLVSGSSSKSSVDSEFSTGTNDYVGRILFAADTEIELISQSTISIESTLVNVTTSSSVSFEVYGFFNITQALGGSFIFGTSGFQTYTTGPLSLTTTSTSELFTVTAAAGTNIRSSTAGRPITLWNTTSGSGYLGRLYDPLNGHISLQATTGLGVATQSSGSEVRFYIGYDLGASYYGLYLFQSDSCSLRARDGSGDESVLMLKTNLPSILEGLYGIDLVTHGVLNIDGLPTSLSGLSTGDVWVDTSDGNTLKIVV